MAAMIPMTTVAAPARVRPARAIRASTALGAGFVALALVAWAVAAVAGYRYGVYLLTAAGFGAAAIGLRSPRIGLLGVAVLCTLDPLMGWLVFTGGVLRWNTFNYLLLLVTLLWTPLLLRRRDLSLRIAQLCVLLLTLELIMSPDRARGIQDVLGFGAVLGLSVYCVRVRFSRDDWYWAGIVCGTIAVVGGMLFLARQGSLPEINRNAWAYFPLTALFTLCVALPCSLERRRGPMIVSALASGCVAWAFLSASRGAMLIALACAAYLLVAMPGLGRRTVLVGIVAITLLGAATQFTSLQELALERVRVLFDPGTRLADRTSHRSDLARGGWYIFRQAPFGVGTGGFTSAWHELGPREGFEMANRYRRLQAHAGWVKILAENGVPGLLVLGGFVLSFAVTGLRSRIRSLRRLGLMTTAVLALAFTSTEYQNKGVWFLAAITIAMMGPTSPLRPARAPSAPRTR